jgi:hypothetical protein
MKPSEMKGNPGSPLIRRGVTILFVLLFASVCNQATGHAGAKRIALVIGNSAYPESPLLNPVNDARLIAATLRELDFLVMEHLDADQKTMKRAIQDFGAQLDDAGREATGLFYYAGHGIQVNGENYLIPVNAAIQRERDVEIEAVNAAAVLGVLDYARTQINFVVIDACRNNPFARSFRSATRGLARMDAPHGTLVAYATAPGDVAHDGEGKNSPYSAALASGMRQPDVPVEQMFKLVRRQVMTETGNAQVPWESSSLTGNFYFAATGGDTAQPPALLGQAEIDKEALFWQSIKESETAGDFQEYLRQFPDGTFAGLAQSRIAALTGSQAVPAGPESTRKAGPKPAEQKPAPQEAAATPAARDAAPVEASPPVLPASEQEPNNSIGGGNYVGPTGITRGRIEPRGDADWYRFSVKQQGELAVQVSNPAPELDLVFRIWDGEYNTIANWQAPLNKGADTSGIIDLPNPGFYCLELRDGHDDAASGQEYQMAMTFRPANDAFEPNNIFGAAAPVNPGSRWLSTILPQGDADWYRLRFDQHGELQVKVSNVPPELDIALRLWDADKRTLSNWHAPLKPGGDTDAVIDIPRPGSYVLEVRDGRDDARSVQPFTTAVAFTPSVDRFEPNNGFGSASPLAIGETVQATILPATDSDWYRVDVDEQGELKVAVTGVPENLDISCRVWNSDLQTITNWFAPLKAGGDTEGTIDLPERGGYVIEIRDGRDDARSVLPYALRATFTPTNDRGEPNNGFGSAVPLKLGASISAAILPRGDADWYRISTVGPGTLAVRIDGSPENLDMVLRVWNEEKQTISNWLAPLRAGGETTGEVAIPKAGAYLIEVRDGRDDDHSVKPYRLTTTMRN